MFKTAIIVSQNSKFCSQKQGKYRLFPLINAIKWSKYLGLSFKGWSTEYHICYYISKCSSWSVVFKSSVCHLGKPGITPVFKMASKMAASYRNDPRNKYACLNQILSIIFFFFFKHLYQCQNVKRVYL